jgi:C-terminal processing protease CtpA/Prc
MKKLSLICLGFLISLSAAGQVKNSEFHEPTKKVKRYIKEFIDVIKQNSLYSDSLNWPNIENNIHNLSNGLKTIDDTQILTEYILSQLSKAGDDHSFLRSKIDEDKYQSQNIDSRQPYSKLLANNIGYIYVPAFGSASDTACQNFAKKIQTFIRNLDCENKIKGWIVDLRDNHGGNMYPMIAGLGPLIGNDTLGYFTSPKSNVKTIGWFYKLGSTGIGGKITLDIKNPYSLKDKNSKIAVLIGSHTASSGEMTAISFIGKSNCKLIGKPSGGYTTGLRGFKLSNGAVLYIASGYSIDRNKKIYIGKIQPDILTEVKTSDNNDTDIVTAQNWIENR